MFRVLAYRRTSNLGDVIQTYAMARLLPQPIHGVYRDAAGSSLDAATFVVNGFLADAAPEDANCLFAGVYVGKRTTEQITWIRRSRFAVGSRDPHTQKLLEQNGIKSDLVGCATLTLPRYEGKRFGVVSVDSDAPSEASKLTNTIDRHLPWAEHWAAAIRQLSILRRAEMVYTTRLHVALPCLAFGTPVVVRRADLERLFQPQRLSILDAIGFGYDKPFAMDVTPFADGFKAFLSAQLGITITPKDDPPLPLCD